MLRTFGALSVTSCEKAIDPQEGLGSPPSRDGAAPGGVQEAFLPAVVDFSVFSPPEVLFGPSGVDSYMFLHTWLGGMRETIK